MNQKGQILIVALAVMAIGLSLGSGFLSYTRTGYRITQAQLDVKRAEYAAQTGIERAWKKLELNFDTYAGESLTWPDGISITIVVAATDEQGRRRATSTGRYGRVTSQTARRFKKETIFREVCWVTDRENNRVIKFDGKTGAVLWAVSYAGQIVWPSSVSINRTSGDGWIGNKNRSWVLKLDDKDGAILTQADIPSGSSSVAVNSTTGHCWAVTNQEVVQWNGSTGLSIFTAGEYNNLRDISVNSTTHHGWVATNQRALKLDGTTGAPVLTIGGLGAPNAISANSTTGECWVAAGNKVFKLNGNTGGILLEVSGIGNTKELSVNPTTGECWVATNQRVLKLNGNTGDTLVTVGSLQGPKEIAVNSVTGDCWVAEEAMRRVLKLKAADGAILLNIGGVGTPSSADVNPREAHFRVRKVL